MIGRWRRGTPPASADQTTVDQPDHYASKPQTEDASKSLDTLGIGARVIATADGYIAVLVITGYPAEVYAPWLDPLIAYPGRLDVSVHIDPVDQVTAAETLRRRLARMESGRAQSAEHGKLPDPLVEAATEDAHELAARVARGEGRLYRVALYLAVHAPDPEILADEVAAVRALAASLLMDARPASWRQWPGWESCLPVGLDQLRTHRVMDTSAIAAAFPFTSPDLPSPDPVSAQAPPGVLYGFNLGSSGLVHWDVFSADNYNAVVLGRSGAGKSYFTKLGLLRSLYQGVHGIVVDPEDEYTRLTEAVGGIVVRVGAPGVALNPLDVPIHTDAAGRHHAPADAVTRRGMVVQTFLETLLDAQLDPATRAVLDDAITTTYTRAGIISGDPTTWTRPAPLLADLAKALAAHRDPDAARLATLLRPWVSGAHAGVFNAPSTRLEGTHLVSYSLRQLPEELRAPATLLVLEQIWREASDPANRRPRLVVVDEAWMLMAHPAAARWLHRMAKSARKHWIGLQFVSQDVADVLGSDLGTAVVTNAATCVLLRQAPQTIDQVARTFSLSAGERQFVLRAEVGQGLLSTGARRVAFQSVASPAEHELITTNPAELAGDGAAADTGIVHLPDRNR